MDERLDNVWKALADPTRREILDLLRDGPRTTGDLAGRFPGLTRFGVMKHLDVLEESGLIVARREGRQRWNHLNAVPLRRIYERWVSRYEDRLAGSLTRLKRAIEEGARDADEGDSRDVAGRSTPPAPPARDQNRSTGMGTKFLEQGPRSAVVEVAIHVEAPRARVYAAFLHEPAAWFYESEQTKDTRPSVIEPVLGGKFFMRTLENGDENLLAILTCIKKDRLIRLRGDCTMPNAFVANMTVRFLDEGSGTRVEIEHRMSGEFPDDLPAGFEEGWMDGLQKLKVLVERGRG